ncbi:MAG: polysaccharide biosynthesis tyrosine autokinase [Burkholderiaceae bacterium]|nr:polysaccharide biosynthesis tyrosine autokinase [Burkholderiaceae bacterium]
MSQTPAISPPLVPAAPGDDEIDLLGLLDTLLDAKWLIAAAVVVVTLLGGAYAFLSRPIYQANTLIQVEESKPGAGSALGEAASLFEIRSPASAEMELLRSRLVVGQAVDELQLFITAVPKRLPLVGNWLAARAQGLSDPGFLGFNGYVSGKEQVQIALLEVSADLEGKRLALIATDNGYRLLDSDGQLLVQGNVGVELGFPGGRILVREVKAKPGAEFHVARLNRQSVIEQVQASLRITEKGRQSGVLSVVLEGSDRERIVRILGAVGANYVGQNVARKAAEADKSLGFLNGFLPELKRQLESSETRFSQFRNQKGTFDLSTEGQLALKSSVDLQTKLVEAEQKRRELLSQFTTAHPSVQVVDAQIAALKKEMAGVNAKVTVLPNVEQELLRLTRDVKVNSELYVSLLNSAQQLRLVREGKVGNVRVVDAAAVGSLPIAPQRGLILIVSAALGLMLGIGLAVLRNVLNPGIRDASEIERNSGLNVFATVPHSEAQGTLFEQIKRKAPGQHLLTLSLPNDPGVESLRSLRTALQFALLDAPNNIVLFTGPTPGIGKSFVSANFAAVLGATGKRVLLVDADLRKGYLNQYFGLDRAPGLSELVAGSCNDADALRVNVAPNVDLITTGQLPPNPAEVLTAGALSQLLLRLSAQYDLVLIDTPPVLAVADTQVVAAHAGTIFLVTKATVSSLGEVNESVKRLQQAGVQIKGVVFNDFKVDKRRYGGYGYRYSRYRYTNYQYGQQ